MIRPHAAIATWISALLLIACSGGSTQAQANPFSVLLRATADDGRVLAGVEFTSGKSRLGTTDERGQASANIYGSEGDNVPIGVTCPSGFLAPEDLTSLRLTRVRRVQQPDPIGLTVDAICTKKVREVAVVVHAVSGPSLPVDVGGKTVAVTDANGNAHIRLDLDRGARQLSVSLRTASDPTLRPQNPSRVFELDGKDAVLILDQAFSRERRRVAKRQVAAAAPVAPKRVPYRIGARGDYGY